MFIPRNEAPIRKTMQATIEGQQHDDQVDLIVGRVNHMASMGQSQETAKKFTDNLLKMLGAEDELNVFNSRVITCEKA